MTMNLLLLANFQRAISTLDFSPNFKLKLYHPGRNLHYSFSLISWALFEPYTYILDSYLQLNTLNIFDIFKLITY